MTRYKRGILLAITAILLPLFSSFAQTQSEMNQDACREYKQADEALNKTYTQILNEYKADTVFIAKLKVAQRAWLAFRDARLEELYPQKDKMAEYGTVYPMCTCLTMTQLTEERAKQLKKWVTGTEEGDACAGSIKYKP